MKKELSKIEKLQNVLFILLNAILVLFGFCFIVIKIEDYELILMIILGVYMILGYSFLLNIIELHEINNKKEN